MIGTTAAAAALGVSPRRVLQLITEGTLAAQQVAGVWIIDERSLDAARQRRPPGRPWSASAAWAVIALASGVEPATPPTAAYRARKRLTRGLDSLADVLAARARLQVFYADPLTRAVVAVLPGVVRTAMSAADEYDLGPVPSDSLHAYIRAGEMKQILTEFALDALADPPNLELRVVLDDAWPFSDADEVAPIAAVALDLIESPDANHRRAGRNLLAQL